MRIRYELQDISNKNKANCVGDLLRYYGETKYKVVDNLQRIKENKTIGSMLVSTIRKHSSMTGLTVDMLIERLENSTKMDFMSFKVNDVAPYELFADKNDMTVEVFMGDIYFETKAMLDEAIPGFRRHKQPVDFYVSKEKMNWVRWFEKNLKEYHGFDKCKKVVLEE